MAASPLPFEGPKRGRKCYITLALSGIPNTGEQNRKWLPPPTISRGPKKSANDSSPMHSRGSSTPSAQSKIGGGPRQRINKRRSGCLTPAFSRAEKRAEVLHQPCKLGEPQQRGTKSEVATSPLPSRGHKTGRNCYITPAFLGIPREISHAKSKCHNPPPPACKKAAAPHACRSEGLEPRTLVDGG